jgi:uncharacterized protein YcfJ
MKPRFVLIPLALATLTLGSAAQAYDRPGGVFYDEARVVDVRPVKELVRVAAPQEECWTEPVRHVHRSGPDTGTYALTGTLIGGVLGNQIGKGDTRRAATAVGAVAGAMIGSDMARSRQQTQVYTTQEQYCQVVDRFYEEERHVGYRVTYRYKGQDYTRTMAHHPGRTVRVRVTVDPAE